MVIDVVLQVRSDLSSSRRKGRLGINFMEEVLAKNNFERERGDKFPSKDKVYIEPDKGDLGLLDYFLFENGLKFEFRGSRENKLPDLVISSNGHFYIVEHKSATGSGGSQNMEINELIHFVSFTENKENVHYVSVLQSLYFNYFRSPKTNTKLSKQRENIDLNLKNHPSNFFLNGSGFAVLISEI